MIRRASFALCCLLLAVVVTTRALDESTLISPAPDVVVTGTSFPFMWTQVQTDMFRLIIQSVDGLQKLSVNVDPFVYCEDFICTFVVVPSAHGWLWRDVAYKWGLKARDGFGDFVKVSNRSRFTMDTLPDTITIDSPGPGEIVATEFVDVGWERDARVGQFRIVVKHQDGTPAVKTDWLTPDSHCSSTACTYNVGLEGSDGDAFKLFVEGRRADVVGKVRSDKRKFSVDLP